MNGRFFLAIRKEIFLFSLFGALCVSGNSSQNSFFSYIFLPKNALANSTNTKINSKQLTEKVLYGILDSIAVTDSAKGTISTIFILSQQTETIITFLVKSTTTIYDKDGKTIHWKYLVKGTRLEIKYLVSKEGINEAIYIKVSKE